MGAIEDAPFDLPHAFAEVLALMVSWGLPSADAEYFLRRAVDLRTLRPRETLYDQGQQVDHMFLLQSGRLFQDRLTRSGDGNVRITLRREIKPGKLIGQYDLLYGDGYSTRVRALDFAQVIQIDADALNRLLVQYPSLRNKIAPAAVVGRLRTAPFLAELDQTTLSFLAEVCDERTANDGDKIYSADENAEAIFLIDEGQVRLEYPASPTEWRGNGMELGTLDADPGESSRGDDARYDHSAIALEATKLFRWPRGAIEELTRFDPDETGRRLRQAREETLSTLPVFDPLEPDQRRRLLGYMSHIYFPIHHFVLQQGEIGDSVWVLMRGGSAVVSALEGRRSMRPTKVWGPNYFNELVLRVDRPHDSTVQAEPGSQWLRLHKDDFQVFLHETDRSVASKLKMSPGAEKYLGQSKQRRRYPWLHFGENLLLFRRRHWIYFVRKMVFPLLAVGLFLALFTLVMAQAWGIEWKLAMTAPLAAVISLFVLWHVVDYLNDYILVTNQRVMRQEKVILFTERRQAAFLEQVRNVDVQTSFFGHVLGYGLINIQTAATDGAIIFDFVPDPNQLKQVILEAQTERLQHFQASGKMTIQYMLEERLGLELNLPDRVTSSVSGSGRNGLSNWRKRLAKLWPRSHRAWEPPPERIVWRKHWLILLAKISGPLLLLGLLGLLFFGQQFLPASLNRMVVAVDWVLGLVTLAGLFWLVWEFADWRNDTYEVDYRQFADVEKKPFFFAENRRTALLTEIENIDLDLATPINYLLNFGNVLIQTAATEGDFTFFWVPNPRYVSEEIWRRVEAYRRRQEEERARRRAEELPDWFEMYDRIGADSKR